MHTIIIAEAGVNHNGDIELAKRLIQIASDAGADYVKFQTFKAANAVSSEAKQADYQIENTGVQESQLEMLSRLELTEEDHLILKEFCSVKKIGFISTAFDHESAVFLAGLGMDLWKIPSGEITNYPFLKFISQQRKPVVLSTGMSTIEEIQAAIDVILSEDLSLDDLTILHCTSEYPAPLRDVNLAAMKTLEKEFGVKVGYSDHTNGIDIPIAAVAMGAKVIEKHFTIDKNLPGPDHKASIDPTELNQMVKSIRNVECAIGSSIKKPSNQELETAKVARKSIHTTREILKGEIIRIEDLIMMRPGTGISPMQIDKIIGKIAKDHINRRAMLSWRDIE